MKPDLLHILQDGQPLSIDEAQLAAYLSNQLDEAARHEIEQKLLEAGQLENDAWEGWQQSENNELLLQKAADINAHLLHQLAPPARRPRKKSITSMPVLWGWMGVLFILICIAWYIIYRLNVSPS